MKPERHTEAKFENEDVAHHHDNWKTKDVAPFEKMWTGRTRFIIDPEQKPAGPVLEKTVEEEIRPGEKKPSSSSKPTSGDSLTNYRSVRSL